MPAQPRPRSNPPRKSGAKATQSARSSSSAKAEVNIDPANLRDRIISGLESFGVHVERLNELVAANIHRLEFEKLERERFTDAHATFPTDPTPGTQPAEPNIVDMGRKGSSSSSVNMVAATPVGPVLSALLDLERITGALWTQIDVLENRLAPILMTRDEHSDSPGDPILEEFPGISTWETSPETVKHAAMIYDQLRSALSKVRQLQYHCGL